MLVLPLAPINHLLFAGTSDHLPCSETCVLLAVSSWLGKCLACPGLAVPALFLTLSLL